jgi:RNA polymerase sigma-70 factor, ECF subfamily
MALAQAHPIDEGTGQLVGRCVAGEDEAWRALHRRYLPKAASFLRCLGVRDHHLEDACQDVFLDVFRHLPRFRGEAQLSTWLYRICVTHARRTRRKKQVVDMVGWVLARSQPATHVPAVEDDAARRVAHALDQLPEHERSVFVLFEIEGVAGKQIAEILGCPEATVWRRLHYARQRFRAAVDETGGTRT